MHEKHFAKLNCDYALDFSYAYKMEGESGFPHLNWTLESGGVGTTGQKVHLTPRVCAAPWDSCQDAQPQLSIQ